MKTHRIANERGQTNIEWLLSYHTFSFGDYSDSKWRKFGHLRVINEDFIQPGQGFGMHPHHNMEILTYIVHGELKHQDTLNNESVIRPLEIQKMSAGTGVMHSEFNNSESDILHLLQIWIYPKEKGITPGYQQEEFLKVPNKLILLGSNSNSQNIVTIHQNVDLYVGFFDRDQTLSINAENKLLWIQTISGQFSCDNLIIEAGDGLGVENESHIELRFKQDSHFLLFEMTE